MKWVGQEQHYHFQDLTLEGPEIFWKRSVHVILKAIRTFQDLEQSNVSKNSKDKNQIRYTAKNVLNTTPNTFIICRSILPFKIHAFVYSSRQVITTDLTLHQDFTL